MFFFKFFESRLCFCELFLVSCGFSGELFFALLQLCEVGFVVSFEVGELLAGVFQFLVGVAKFFDCSACLFNSCMVGRFLFQGVDALFECSL